MDQVKQNESIEELKSNVSFLIDSAEAAERVYEDGKVEREEVFAEGMQLALKANKIVNIKKGIEQTKHLKNPLKRQELLEFIKRDLDLKDDEVEELVEGALTVVKDIANLTEIVQNLRKKRQKSE